MTEGAPGGLHLLGKLVSGKTLLDRVSLEAWTAVVDLAIAHGLHAELSHLARQDGFPWSDSPATSRLHREAALSAGRTMLHDQAQREISRAFTVAHIPHIWLKGAALAHLVYPDPVLRPMVDLDVLVQPAHLEQAITCVSAIGYQPKNDFGLFAAGDPLIADYVYNVTVVGGTASQVNVEIHVALLMPKRGPTSGTDYLPWFWEQTAELHLPGLTVTTLTAEAHLLYVCAHAVLHHRQDDGVLLRYWDVHRLVLRGALNWSVIVEQAAAFRWTFACERALRLVVDYFSTPVPDAVFDDLRAYRSPDEDVDQVLRQSGAGWRFEWLAGMLTDLPPREKLRLLRTVLLPPPAYMRERYHVPPGRPVFPYYLRRWAEQGLDTLAALWKRARDVVSRSRASGR